MAEFTINNYGDGDLKIIGWQLIVPKDATIGEIQVLLQEIENIDESIMTVFTPRAMKEFYKVPECIMENVIRYDIGVAFGYNGNTFKKVTEHLCTVEEPEEK